MCIVGAISQKWLTSFSSLIQIRELNNRQVPWATIFGIAGFTAYIYFDLKVKTALHSRY